jgi:hypothetical protein
MINNSKINNKKKNISKNRENIDNKLNRWMKKNNIIKCKETKVIRLI